MEIEKRNRNIVICVVVLLLLLVVGFSIGGIAFSNKNKNTLINLKINQIYSSDYNLTNYGDYFIGTYDENKISVIINKNGEEVYKGVNDIYYDGIYKMKDERYLIYSNIDNKLITYIFDGVDIKKFYEIDNVTNAKPIIFKSNTNSYIVGFVSMVEDDLFLYGLNSNGIIVVDNVSIVADNNDNGIYYINHPQYLVVKEKDGLMGVIDLEGNVIIDYKYKNIINTYNNSFIALNKKGKYGIVNKNDEVLLKFKYKVIDFYNNYYVVVNDNNKMALYGLDYDKITDFEMNYDTLIDYDLRSEYNSINLYKIDGKVVIINNYMELENGIEYDKHNLYVINNGEVVKKIKQSGFGNDDVIYTYDKENISIYDKQFLLLFELKIEDFKKVESIKYVSNDVIYLKYYNNQDKIISKYYDLKGNETDFNLGKLFIKGIDYYGYIKEEKDIKTLTLYDFDGNVLDDIYGTKIKKYGDYLIVDNGIYRIEVLKDQQ